METYSVPQSLVDLAQELLDEARKRRLRLVTAESCTAGLVAATLTEVSGSADCVEAGLVVYANRAKEELLGVPGELLAEHGAVSREVALAMAEGAVARTHAHVGVSITGIAGPTGGTEAKPVGLVHFACARQDGGEALHREERFGDIGRMEVRTESIRVALEMMRQRVCETDAPLDEPAR